MLQQIKQGNGWRVGWNRDAPIYQGLIGTDDWAIELTATEMKELQRLLTQLIESFTAIADQLMDEEKIAVEVESNILWLEAEGYVNHYALSLILNQNRRCEAHWPASAVPSLVQAIQIIKV
jgi:hypothetical protein